MATADATGYYELIFGAGWVVLTVIFPVIIAFEKKKQLDMRGDPNAALAMLGWLLVLIPLMTSITYAGYLLIEQALGIPALELARLFAKNYLHF